MTCYVPKAYLARIFTRQHSRFNFYQSLSTSTSNDSSNSANKTTASNSNTDTSDSRQRATCLRWFFNTSIDKAIEQPLVKLNPIAMMYSSMSDDNSHLIKSSIYLRRELPIRIAHIIKELRLLPFIIGCNSSILEIHERYVRAFRSFENFDIEIKDLDGEKRFCDLIQETLNANKDILSFLAEGFRDARRYIKNEDCIKTHINRILCARLATRLLCEHHLALHKQYDQQFSVSNAPSIKNYSTLTNDYNDKPYTPQNNANWVGIINKKFSPKKAIETSSVIASHLCKNKYGVSPKLKIDGHINATFVYTPMPVEYILPELLKNAFRATVEHNLSLHNPLPDVRATISVNDKDCVICIRDRGGGIPHSIIPHIFDYHFTTSSDRTSYADSGDDMDKNMGLGLLCEPSQSQSVMHGYGFGLPTSRVYAEYLGGSLTFQTLQGIGSDFYLRLALLDTEPSLVRI